MSEDKNPIVVGFVNGRRPGVLALLLKTSRPTSRGLSRPFLALVRDIDCTLYPTIVFTFVVVTLPAVADCTEGSDLIALLTKQRNDALDLNTKLQADLITTQMELAELKKEEEKEEQVN